MADERFDGKAVVITGAGSGIGRSSALLFARLGAKVHVVDLDAGAAEAVRSTIEVAGGRAAAHEVDVSDPAAVGALAARVFEDDGAVDVLHNNAGVGHAGPVEETTLEDWQRVIGVNLMGVVHGVHFFVPRMLGQGRPAHVVNTASGAGLLAWAGMAPYCTSKFGVVGLSEALNAELAPRGIHVTAVCPGVINTPIVDATTISGEFADRRELRKYFDRFGVSPDGVATAVVKAVRGRRVIRTAPRSHVAPIWALKRISTQASQLVSRHAPRLVLRGR